MWNVDDSAGWAEYAELALLDLKVWWTGTVRGLPLRLKLLLSLPKPRRELLEILFSILGRFASADGRIGENELDRIEDIMRELLSLSNEERLYVFSVLRQGNQERLTVAQVLQRHLKKLKSSPRLARQLYQGLLYVAYADGAVASAEREALMDVLRALEVSADEAAALEAWHVRFEKVLRDRDRLNERIWQRKDKQQGKARDRARDTFRQKQNRRESKEQVFNSPEAEHLAVLGLKPGDSTQRIKSNYRKLVQKLHPDRLRSQNLSPEYVNMAVAEFRRVQTAYDELMKTRR